MAEPMGFFTDTTVYIGCKASGTDRDRLPAHYRC
jgi:hypothetical protein